MKRAITFEQAKAQYPHRYTMQHVPAWTNKPCNANGKYYAPQYASDAEWYENTIFPGEKHIHKNENHAQSNNQSWPLGNWLDKPYKGN